MREKNRKPIASIKKLPQFTTMNVIDGQAGLISYFSLIFYSLTIDNILNIIVLLILAGVTIATLTGDNGILTKATEAQEDTEIAEEKEKVELSATGALTKANGGEISQENLEEELGKYFETGKYAVEVGINDDGTEGYIVTITENDANGRTYFVDKTGNIEEYIQRNPIEIPETGGEEFSRAYGKIDILFLQGTSYDVGSANAPVVDKDNMIPVNWNGTDWIVTTEENWDFEYGTTDETKKWANVMLRDTLIVEGIADAKTATIEEMKGKKVITEGSMLVWIPRYAYKITYYSDSSMTTPVGYSDARGFVDTEGRTPSNIVNEPITSIAVADNYRPHPAFEDGSKTGYTQGEWDKKIKGIWIGKAATTEKVNGKVTIQPNKRYYNASIGQAYKDAQDLDIANSHMAKNSEWGAMVYLAESIYGINGKEAELRNQNTIAEDYKTFLEASTTGNVYGIYHTAAGCYNYTAAYIPDNSTYNGNSFASINNTTNNKTESTKYATVYSMVGEDSTPEENYELNLNRMFGDGIIETSEDNSTPWHASPYADFVGKGTWAGAEYHPFFYRSGSPVSYGKFLFSAYTGSNVYGIDDPFGFTICCIVE